MSIATNKAIVERFNGLFADGALADILGLMTEDATWTVKGKPHLFAGARTYNKAEMEGVWEALYAKLDGTLRMDVIGMTAEDDRVAAEIRSHAVTKAGATYANDYHMLFTLRGGRVASVVEYTDLMHAAEIFG
jgi:ketosteroid isomerase-like protein